MRQNLNLPHSQEAWSASFVTRLQFLNKEHRRRVKNDVQALSTRLRQDYGQSTAGCDAKSRLDVQVQAVMGAYADAEQLMVQVRVPL